MHISNCCKSIYILDMILLNINSERTARDILISPSDNEHVAAGLLHLILDSILQVTLMLHHQLLTGTFGTHHSNVHDVVACRWRELGEYIIHTSAINVKSQRKCLENTANLEQGNTCRSRGFKKYYHACKTQYVWFQET